MLLAAPGKCLRRPEALPARRYFRAAAGAAVLLVCASEAAAQRVPVARYDERDGLPQSQVTGLTRDRSGFLWVATKNGGLARFDGTTFRLADAAVGFAERVVGPLLADGDGSLWVGGPSLYVGRSGRFFRLLSEPIDTLARGPGKTVLAGGPGGVFLLTPSGREIRVLRLDSRPAAAVAHQDGTTWVGGPDGLERIVAGEKVPADPSGVAVLSVVPVGDGLVLAGTETGLFAVDAAGRARPLDVPLPSPRVDALLRDGAGRVWAGTPRGAVRLSRDLSATDLGPADGLPSQRILSLGSGAGSEVWLGGDGSGLFRYAPSRFAVVGNEAGLPETLPLSIAEDPDGSLWITTPRGELARLLGGRFELVGADHGLPRTDRFRDVVVAPDGRVDATFAQGLVRREPGAVRFRTILLTGAERTTGVALAGSAGGGTETWVGTTSGLRVVRGDRFVAAAEGALGTSRIDALAPDPSGGLLAAANGDVFAVEVGSAKASRLARVAPLLGGEAPWHLARSRDGAVWASSIRGAVRIGSGGSVRVLNRASGLPDESVDAVNPASDGEVWLTTDRGIVRASAEGEVLRVFGFADGLPAREGIVRSACRDSRGRLWFGLVGALIRYDPLADEAAPPPPGVHVEALRVPDRRRGEAAVEVDLSVVEFADPRAARVVWRLSPLDAAFGRPHEGRVLRWAGLPPGAYDLALRAVDRTGRLGPVTSVRFAVPALWHETGWAKALLVLLALALGASLPAFLKAAAHVVSRLQAQVSYRVRELFAPPYVPIEDDPFSPGSPVPPLAQEEAVRVVREGVAQAFQRHAIFVVAAPPGSGKTTFLTSLAVSGPGEGFLAVPLPAREPERGADLTLVFRALRARGVDVEPAAPSGESSPLARLTRAVEALSEAASRADIDLLLLEDAPGPLDRDEAQARLALASTLLAAGPRVSLLLARDVPPSIFAAEEPELARVARFVPLREATQEEGASWLSEVLGRRARFAPGAAEEAVREVGGDPLALRFFGSTLLRHLAGKRSNRADKAEVRTVLLDWDASPPPFLSTLWARLSSAERAVAAALAFVDRGRGELHQIGSVLDVLFVQKVLIGAVEAGAIAARLAEGGFLTREGERIGFRSPLVARFAALHRPLSEERSGGAGVLGPYELLEKIGSGGMGTVWRARRLDTRVEVALKVIHPHLLATAEMRKRFLREGEIASRLQHPGIVRVLERGEAAGQAYIAMEYIRGETLKEIVKRSGPLPPAVAARLVRDVAEAVSIIHALGIVHRDLKSENVVVTASGQPKLLDFGLARTTEGTRFTQSGYAAGTPDFMSPEQIRGETATPATDTWALGVALYELLTAQLPFSRPEAAATFQAILEGDPPPPSEVREGIPASLEKVVLRALRKRPEERWPSCGAMRDQLEVLLPTLPPASLEEVLTVFSSGINTHPMLPLPGKPA